MALTDAKIRSLVAKEKSYSVADGEGLQLNISPAGMKTWQYRYRMNGTKGSQEKVTMGRYPEISLSEARLRRSEFKRMVSNGTSPAKAKQEQKTAKLESDKLADFSLSWVDNVVSLTNQKPDNIRRVLMVDIIPLIGHKNLSDVTQTDVLKITDKIKERGADTAALLAKKVLSRMFEYAISRQKTLFNPAAIKSKYIATPKPHNRDLSKIEITLLMKALYSSTMTHSNKLALHLLMICMVRKSNVLQAKWSEIDLEQREWIIPADKMKMKRSHVVYLPIQAVELFKELKQMSGHSEFVLPSRSDNKKHIAHNTLNTAVKRLELEIPYFRLHDFRHTASTLLRENGYPRDVVEMALAHDEGGMAGIYNKAEYKEQRKEMLQTWANFIDSLMTDNKVVFGNFRKTA